MRLATRCAPAGKSEGGARAGGPAQPLRSYTAALRALLAAGAKKELRSGAGRALTALGEAVASNNAAGAAALLEQHALATVTCKRCATRDCGSKMRCARVPRASGACGRVRLRIRRVR